MKICVLSLEFPPFFSIGGIGTYVRTICEDLADLGVQIDVYCGGNLSGDFQLSRNLAVHPFRSGHCTRDLSEMILLANSRSCRKEADITFAHFPYIFLYPCVASLDKDPFVYGVHATFAEERAMSLDGTGGFRRKAWLWQMKLYSLMERRCFKRQRAIVVLSDKEREVLRKMGVSEDKLHVVPWGINPQEYDPGLVDEPCEEKLRVEKGEKVILYVGQLIPRKGVQDLLEAVSMLRREDFKVIIVGQGSWRRYIERMAIELGLQDRVRFTGYISEREKRALLRMCYMLALPSRGEALGVAAIEAMAFSKPVVVTSTTGISSYIKDYGESVVEPRNSLRLAHAIEHLLDDEDMAKEIGSNNRRIVEESFDRKRNAQLLLKVFNSIMES